MAKTFIAILIIGGLLIMLVGLVFQYVEPMPTSNTTGTEWVDDVSFDRAIIEGDIVTLAQTQPLREIMPAVKIFSALLFLTFLIAMIFSRFGGTGLMTIWRWRREDESMYSRSAYQAPDRKEEIPIHRIDPNNP
jgi:hypothetical protein